MTQSRTTSIRLHHDRFPGRPAFDTAVSHALLRRVATGELSETLRLYRPEDVLLFSRLDAKRPGYARAVERAREAGFGTVFRLAGGHAAAFLEQSMAFAWAIPDPQANLRIHQRFEALAEIVVAALERRGRDARVGSVPGAYCPGEYSVYNAGRGKVMGVGQRVIRGAAHVGGVLTVGQSEALRDTLAPVYEALELAFDPKSAGGIADFDPSLGVEDVVASVRAVFEEKGSAFDTVPVDTETLEVAGKLHASHRSLGSDDPVSPAMPGRRAGYG